MDGCPGLSARSIPFRSPTDALDVKSSLRIQCCLFIYHSVRTERTRCRLGNAFKFPIVYSPLYLATFSHVKVYDFKFRENAGYRLLAKGSFRPLPLLRNPHSLIVESRIPAC